MGYEREMSYRQKAIELSKKRGAIEAEMDAIFNSLTVCKTNWNQDGQSLTPLFLAIIFLHIDERWTRNVR